MIKFIISDLIKLLVITADNIILALIVLYIYFNRQIHVFIRIKEYFNMFNLVIYLYSSKFYVVIWTGIVSETSL